MKTGIHGCPLEPIDPKPLLADVPVIRTVLPEEISAFTERWFTRRRMLRAVGYRWELEEEIESASLRHALAHEFGHVFFLHEGDIIYLYRRGYTWRNWALDEQINSFQDRQSEAVASFVLLPPEALKEYGRDGPSHVARAMDVPEHLVEIRWQIWGKFQR